MTPDEYTTLPNHLSIENRVYQPWEIADEVQRFCGPNFPLISYYAYKELEAELKEMTKMRDNIHRKLLNCDTARNGLSLMVTQLEAENAKLKELLHDLDAILKTALHNGHHDLIQRVSEACK